MNAFKQYWYAICFGIRRDNAFFRTRAEYEAQEWPRTRLTLAAMTFEDDSRDYRAMLVRVRRTRDLENRMLCVPSGDARFGELYERWRRGPEYVVNAELSMGCSWREYEERVAHKFGIAF